MIDVLSPVMLLLYAILFGITMKIADLFNEHGFKWFKFSNLIFGALWGLFGALLLVGDVAVANIILAMNIAFLIRRRIDYLNHAIAVTIIIVSFLLFSRFDASLFLVFYFVFLIFGRLKDYFDDVRKMEHTRLFTINEAMLYYPIPTLVYCLLFGNWTVFFIFLLFTVSYDATKYYAAKRSYK